MDNVKRMKLLLVNFSTIKVSREKPQVLQLICVFADNEVE